MLVSFYLSGVLYIMICYALFQLIDNTARRCFQHHFSIEFKLCDSIKKRTSTNLYNLAIHR